MKLQYPASISNSSTLQDTIRFASICFQKLQSVVNGNVDLIDNGNNQLLTFTFTKANADVGVPHSLGRVPRGYINAGSSNSSLGLSNGNTPNSTNVIYLQANAAGTVTVMVF